MNRLMRADRRKLLMDGDACRMGLALAGMGIALTMVACTRGPCSISQAVGDGTDEPLCGSVYVAQGDPYQAGLLAVKLLRIARCENDAPLDLIALAPEEAGAYPIVVFQHGFLLDNTSYSGMLRHLASHGFVVVAPQMYKAGLAPLLGSPTVVQEAEWAAAVLDWLPAGLELPAGVQACTDRVGLAGHSRGGKVVWLMLSNDPTRAIAVAGVDPVDGTGGPSGGQDRVVDGPFDFPFPSLVIGTGLGGACSPEGDNHEQFYAASVSPAWHVVVPDQGHGDMLDKDSTDSG